jgi:type II secretory pathway pseudopilin PulG
MHKNHKHRLLLDFIVVFIIILVLFIGVSHVFVSGQAAANNQERQQNLAQVETALEQFYYNYKVFPKAIGPPVDTDGSIIPHLRSSRGAIDTLIRDGFLSESPSDPDPAYKYIYVVANNDNFSGGEKLQRYALYAIKQETIPNFATTLNKIESTIEFIATGNAAEQFDISAEQYNELMLGDHNIPRVEGRMVIEPSGGTAVAF